MGGPPIGSTCDTSDHKSRDEDLRVIPEEGRSGYDAPIRLDTVRVAVVEVDGELYDTDDGIETEDSIRRMLAEADREDNMEELCKQIDAELNPKPWEGRESFYGTTRVKLSQDRELVIGEKMKTRMSYPRFAYLREWD